jgi:hypothetical protein
MILLDLQSIDFINESNKFDQNGESLMEFMTVPLLVIGIAMAIRSIGAIVLIPARKRINLSANASLIEAS